MKTIFFDFDGTLTKKGNENIWESIWKKCRLYTGNDSVYQLLFDWFKRNKISHQEWCDETCKRFKNRDFRQEDLEELTGKIELIDGLEETLKRLKDSGYSLHILSGNFKSVIESVLGDLVQYFDAISANDIIFDANGKLIAIKGTDYDFEGKADYIKQYAESTGSKKEDLTFVGNGDNDEWAYMAGCNTLCINPDNTDGNDEDIWHENAGDVDNLTSILDYILPNEVCM